MDSRNGRSMLRKWAANLVWILLGIVAYAVCIDIFGGYPQVHSEALDWAAVILIVLAGALAWYWHERHGAE